MSESLFLAASRLKLRFPSPRGELTAEDLWDLPLTSTTGKANLDDIARGLFKKLKSDDTVSFVTPEKKSDPQAQLAFDLVKYVIDTRVSENAVAAAAKALKDKKQQIMAIIEEKKLAGLKDSSIADLEATLAAMG